MKCLVIDPDVRPNIEELIDYYQSEKYEVCINN